MTNNRVRSYGIHIGILPAGKFNAVTDVPGVMPVIRVADCVPILLCGEKACGDPVVGAVHAGWRGIASGIAAVAVEKMVGLGARRAHWAMLL